jgi:hypothetical protein
LREGGGMDAAERLRIWTRGGVSQVKSPSCRGVRA